MNEYIEILEEWIVTGQVITTRGRSHTDLLTLLGKIKVALRQPLVGSSAPKFHCSKCTGMKDIEDFYKE